MEEPGRSAGVPPASPSRAPMESAAPKAVLLDLDGTLYVGSSPISGAADAVKRLRNAGLKLYFLTNTTTRSERELREALGRMGMPVAEGELVTPARIAAGLLRTRAAASCLFVVREQLRAEFEGIAEDREHPELIVIGDIGEAWDYTLMNRLFRLVMGGAGIIALHKGRFWERPDGLSLDIGAFVTALEYATGRRAEVVGKPAPAFFLEPLRAIEVAPAEAIIVGDDIDSDIGGAAAVGLRGVLVRTGKYREEYVERSSVKPWRAIDSAAQLPRLLGLE